MGLFLDTIQRRKQVKGRRLNQSGEAMSYVTAFKRGYNTTYLTGKHLLWIESKESIKKFDCNIKIRDTTD